MTQRSLGIGGTLFRRSGVFWMQRVTSDHEATHPITFKLREQVSLRSVASARALGRVYFLIYFYRSYMLSMGIELQARFVHDLDWS